MIGSPVGRLVPQIVNILGPARLGRAVVVEPVDQRVGEFGGQFLALQQAAKHFQVIGAHPGVAQEIIQIEAPLRIDDLTGYQTTFRRQRRQYLRPGLRQIVGIIVACIQRQYNRRPLQRTVTHGFCLCALA